MLTYPSCKMSIDMICYRELFERLQARLWIIRAANYKLATRGMQIRAFEDQGKIITKTQKEDKPQKIRRKIQIFE